MPSTAIMKPSYDAIFNGTQLTVKVLDGEPWLDRNNSTKTIEFPREVDNCPETAPCKLAKDWNGTDEQLDFEAWDQPTK